VEHGERSDKRNIIKTLLVYLGGAWVFIEAIIFLIDKYDWNTTMLDVLILLVKFGLPALHIYTRYQQKITRKAIDLQVLNGVLALTVIDVKAPTFTAAACMPNLDPELVPGTCTISYKYDDFVMSYVSATRPTKEISRDPSFYGSKGNLFVHRSGYLILPTSGRGVEAAHEAKDFLEDDSVAAERASEAVHVRNWLDCIKSRQQPTCNEELGFYSSLSPLLGRQAIQEGRALRWDPMTKPEKTL